MLNRLYHVAVLAVIGSAAITTSLALDHRGMTAARQVASGAAAVLAGLCLWGINIGIVHLRRTRG
jgi:hypothetical protein